MYWLTLLIHTEILECILCLYPSTTDLGGFVAFFKTYFIFINMYCVCMYVYVYVHAGASGGQKTIDREQRKIIKITKYFGSSAWVYLSVIQ